MPSRPVGLHPRDRTTMKRLRTPTGLLATVVVAVISIAAVAALAVVETDAPARIYQLDAVIRVATSVGGLDG